MLPVSLQPPINLLYFLQYIKIKILGGGGVVLFTSAPKTINNLMKFGFGVLFLKTSGEFYLCEKTQMKLQVTKMPHYKKKWQV